MAVGTSQVQVSRGGQKVLCIAQAQLGTLLDQLCRALHLIGGQVLHRHGLHHRARIGRTLRASQTSLMNKWYRIMADTPLLA